MGRSQECRVPPIAARGQYRRPRRLSPMLGPGTSTTTPQGTSRGLYAIVARTVVWMFLSAAGPASVCGPIRQETVAHVSPRWR